jgi:hypothetical protein
MSLRAPALTSPPRTVIAFRVGIVGHRPNRLPKDNENLDMLRQALREVLEEVKTEVSNYAASPSTRALYSEAPYVLRAVSPLAEGTDRIFADQAIDLGYELLCPMPFAQEEFEKDFLPPEALEPDSRERFRGLLKRAREGAGVTTFELDGNRSAAPNAYALGGRVVLNQSDLLIVVWDGQNRAGDGSTVDTAQEAIRFRVPVLWIDALAPRNWQLLRDAEDMRCLEGNDRCMPRDHGCGDPAQARKSLAEAVRRIVHEEIAPPDPLAGPHQVQTTQSQATEYFRERKPRFNFAFAWKIFRDAVGSARFHLPKVLVPDFESQVRKTWPVSGDAGDSAASPASAASGHDQSSPPDLNDWVNSRLRGHYAWPDKRGDLFADAYRSGYVLTYLLSAIAVLVALLPMAAGLEGKAQTICVLIEFVMLLGILLLFVIGRTRRWHERWMEQRLLAELIRQLRVLIPLGGGRPFPRTPTHLGVYGNLSQTWMYWHMRAIARGAGIPNARVTHDYVLNCLSYIDRIVGGPDEGQFKFHKDTETRSEHIAHRLHKTSAWLFGLTLFGIALHLLMELLGSAAVPMGMKFEIPEHVRKGIDHWLVLASAFLPAMAAALAAISNQGEFARVAKRSAAMADSCGRFTRQISVLRSGNARGVLKLSQVIPLAAEIAEVMVDEVADWRVVFIDRPPTAG